MSLGVSGAELEGDVLVVGGASLALGAQAQVGRGTLYRHFGSKEGLFAATLRDLAKASPPLPPDLSVATT